MMQLFVFLALEDIQEMYIKGQWNFKDHKRTTHAKGDNWFWIYHSTFLLTYKISINLEGKIEAS